MSVDLKMPYNVFSDSDRKNQLLCIARRSRIKWVRSAGDNRKKLKSTGKNEQTISTSKVLSTNSLQRTFDFLADLVADGETVDIDSLFPEIDADECDDVAYDDTKESDELIHIISPSGDSDSYSYPVFLENLCLRNSISIVKSFQQFVSKFETRVRMRRTSLEIHCYINEKSNNEEITKGAQSIWLFLEHISCEMEESSVAVWRGPDNPLKEQTKSYCESFIFSKLYTSTFHSDYEECFLNEKLRERIQSLSFLLPEHLDIKILSNHSSSRRESDIDQIELFERKFDFVDKAVLLLTGLEDATCPDDKMKCIRGASTSIASGLMRMSAVLLNEDNIIPPGADDVLPLLIFCVKESNPQYLHSELKYLQTYLDPSQLQSENGYLITQMQSVVYFLENVDASALTISPDEFNRSLKKCKEIERDANMISIPATINNLSEEERLQVRIIL